MTKLLLIILITLIAGCSEFPTSFDRIEKSELRVLDFIYNPPEAAPGDTVQVKAVFAGKKVYLADIDWKISYNLINNVYGTDTAFDIVPLPVTPVENYFSKNTTCISFSFIVPEDIIAKHGQIPANWWELVPAEVSDSIPAEFKSISKNQILSTMENASIPGTAEAQNPVLLSYLPLVSQLFTVQMQLLAEIKNDFTIESKYSVRYNSRLKKNPGITIEVNHNNRIDSVGVYKVPGELKKYDPSAMIHTFNRVDGTYGDNDTLLIDKGYSYFLRVFTQAPERTQSVQNVLDGSSQDEVVIPVWFFEQNENEIKDVSPNDYFEFGNGDTLVQMFPPGNGSIKTITIWTQILDMLINERYRPEGSSLIEASLNLKYTEDYLKAIK
jgi:hypothetical protein